MSYILDALRKSDLQRQHAKAPTLLTAQTMQEAPRKSSFALNAWLGAVLIGAGVLIGWLRPWQEETPTSTSKPVAVQPTASSTGITISMPVQSDIPANREINTTPSTAKPAAQAAPALATMASAPVTAVTQQPAPQSSTTDSIIPIPQDVTAALPAKPLATQSAQQNAVLTLSELPPPIRQALPNILIAFHQYSSTPAERRVMINNVVLRQGESIAPGLKLEKITPDGVVVSYQGYHFQRGVR